MNPIATINSSEIQNLIEHEQESCEILDEMSEKLDKYIKISTRAEFKRKIVKDKIRKANL